MSSILFHLGLLNPIKLFRLGLAILKHGVNLFTLIVIKKITIQTEKHSITTKDIKIKSYALAQLLHKQHNINESDKVAIIANNSTDTVLTLFALSRLGANIYCLSPDLKTLQIDELQNKFNFKKVIQNTSTFNKKITTKLPKLRPSYKGSITTLTSGTSGIPSPKKRKYTISNYLPTLNCLVNEIKIQRQRHIYIPIPITQAFGLASFISSICFDKNITISNGLKTNLIAQNNIDSLITVPTLLNKLNKTPLPPLTTIISGGANLNQKLVEQTIKIHGNILFNLYGTNEIGFSAFSSPNRLDNIQTCTRLIPLKNIDVKTDNKNILYIKNPSSFSKEWINTGDKARIHKDGSIELLGRLDDIIVSGGINISPKQLEQILLSNESITSANAYAIEDEYFEYRLNATCDTKLSKTEVKRWLETNCPKHLKPKEIHIQ